MRNVLWREFPFLLQCSNSSLSRTSFITSLASPTKFVQLSLQIVVGKPLWATNLRRVANRFQMYRLHGQWHEDCDVALREDSLEDGSTLVVEVSSVVDTSKPLKIIRLQNQDVPWAVASMHLPHEAIANFYPSLFVAHVQCKIAGQGKLTPQ